MKKIILIAFTATILLGCQDDIIVDADSEFAGLFEGEYVLVENYSNPASKITNKQIVSWKFTDVQYRCSVHVNVPNFPDFSCDFYGNYELGTQLELVYLGYGRNRTCTSDSSAIAYGPFSVRWGRNNPDGLDSLVLSQFDIEEDRQKVIKLKRLPIEEDDG
jgi:hypothetical protein